MHYIIYLASTLLLLVGAGCISSYPVPLCFMPSQLLNYMDMPSLLFILLPCLLVLFCTKSFSNLRDSFLFMLGKKNTPANGSMQAVAAVMVTSATAGVIHAVIVMIQLLRSMNPDGVSYLGNSVLVALLSLFYALVLWMVLLPVLISVWKHERAGAPVHPPKVRNKK